MFYYRVLVEYVPTFSPGLNFPCAHYYNTRQRTAAVAAMPLVVKLLLVGDDVVKVNIRKRTDQNRKADRPTVAAASAAYYRFS